MDKLNEPVSSTSSAVEDQRLELAGRQTLVLSRSEGEDLVRFLSPRGEVVLTVQITAQGPVLRFEGPVLGIQAAGSLTIDAEHLHLRGRKSLSASTDGDLELQAAGDLTSEARIQHVTATLGNVNVKANDDVRLNGERVMVNC